MEKFKEITRQEFVEILRENLNFNKSDIDTYFEIKGGRGAICRLQAMFTEEMNQVANVIGKITVDGGMSLSSGFQFSKVFISGLGWIEIKHESIIDKDSGVSVDIVKNLPIHCYNFLLYRGKETAYLGEFSVLRRLTLGERFKQWLGKTKPTFTYWT